MTIYDNIYIYTHIILYTHIYIYTYYIIHVYIHLYTYIYIYNAHAIIYIQIDSIYLYTYKCAAKNTTTDWDGIYVV